VGNARGWMACGLLGLEHERASRIPAWSSELDAGYHMVTTCVRMTIEWFVPLGQTRPITMALHSLAAETRSARGCIGCSVATDIGNRGTVRYTEEWLTENDLRQRVRGDSFNQLVSLIEDATQPPRIEFLLAHEKRGLDYVTEVRSTTQ
jgi:quinol monooxygenase YgiN